MYPHEKPGYVEACHKAGVCSSVLNPGAGNGEIPIYCDKEQHEYLADGSALHTGWFSPWTTKVVWTDKDALRLGGGVR
jgi:hypothetical protein